MKKFLTSVAMVLLLAGCAQKYDDSAITARLSAIETKLIELEGNIMALQSAIGEGVFVAKVQEHVDAESGKTDGVTITYTNGDVKWFKIETNVADVNAPVLGVITSGSGDLVWAVNGTAIVIDGKEVPVYQTPVFTLDDDGFLWVEVNGKKAKLGQVQNEGATLVDGIFTDIKVEQDKIVLTLSDGTKVNVPFAEAFQLVLEKTEFVYAVLGPIDVFYEVNAATANTVVGVAGYNPKEFSVELKPENKKVVITPLKEKASGVFLVYADSKIGLTSLVSIVVEAEGVEVVDEPFSDEVDYMADGELGLVTANVVANVPFDVKPVEDWIHVVAVKSKVYTISLDLDDNDTGVIRVGTVNIVKEGTDEVIQSFKIGQDFIPEGPKNLSSKGAANSYIVTAAGDYMFAAVKGNTVESVGAVSSVEILWETENTATAPNVNDIIAKVSYADGYISFSTPETLKPGNAVIAAKNGETILWSWHIWIPKTDVTVQDAVAFSGANMMDRNLGALVTTAATGDVDPLSIGLYYQWGRKDPFPGHHSFGTDEGAKVAGISMTKHGEAADMAYAIAHPTEYIHQKGVWDCWWNSEEPTDSWNSSDNKKTIYDPCPPGYRVPIRDGDKPMWSTSSTGWTFTTAEHRIKYGDFVFPTCGYIDCDGGSYYKSDIRCFVWSATHRDQKRSYTLLFNTSNIDDSSNHKAKAGNVRCVVDDGTPVIPEPPKPVVPAVDLSKDATANCYIVTKAGDYKFKTVKGNGTESVGTVAEAELIWETYNNAEEVANNSVIAAVSYADDYITFSTPATLKPGNALIAAKDAAGTILWSWHIWIPKTEIESGTYGVCEGMLIMDRNLGALEVATTDKLTSPESLGMVYQWGRKDPFLGAGAVAKDAAVATVSSASKAIEIVETAISSSDAIKEPWKFAVVSGGDWLDTLDDTRWGASKTINDPCPAGYRVPRENETILFKERKDGWTYDGTLSMTFKLGDAVFPITGYRRNSSKGAFDRTSIRAKYWSSSVKAENPKSYMLYVYEGPVYAAYSDARCDGDPIRCVTEATAE